MKWNVIITRYKEPNEIFHEALISLSKQINIEIEVLVLDQFINIDTEKLCIKLTESTTHKFKYILIEPISLSYARNYWIEKSSTDYCLFLDADAISDEKWASEIVKVFIENNNVWIVWTKILAKWNWKRNILTYSNYFLSEYSLLDIWDENINVSKVIWASFALNKNILWKEAYFDSNLWRKDWVLLWWEETELCERVIDKWLKVFYVWKSFVYHQISKDRLKYKWIIKRVFWWGVSRWLKWWKPSPVKINRTYKDYLLLPFYLLFYIPGLIYSKFIFQK
jgi:glycosyltransferase involved in cell wall biosynthesis